MDYGQNDIGVFSKAERIEYDHCRTLLAEKGGRWYWGNEGEYGDGGWGYFPQEGEKFAESREAAIEESWKEIVRQLQVELKWHEKAGREAESIRKSLESVMELTLF